MQLHAHWLHSFFNYPRRYQAYTYAYTHMHKATHTHTYIQNGTYYSCDHSWWDSSFTCSFMPSDYISVCTHTHVCVWAHTTKHTHTSIYIHTQIETHHSCDHSWRDSSFTCSFVPTDYIYVCIYIHTCEWAHTTQTYTHIYIHAYTNRNAPQSWSLLMRWLCHMRFRLYSRVQSVYVPNVEAYTHSHTYSKNTWLRTTVVITPDEIALSHATSCPLITFCSAARAAHGTDSAILLPTGSAPVYMYVCV
jgi:hypothetical protein